jgi:hypothetical protein
MTTAIVIILVALGIIVWGATRKSRIGHWMRVVVMFLSGGFIFPHALTEEEDIANKTASKEAKPKNG